MENFKPIETQEEFEEVLKPRLARAQETARKKAFEEFQTQLNEANGYKEQVTTLSKTLEEQNGKIEALTAQLGEANATAKAFETKAIRTQAILDHGLPVEFADRLKGETAEEIEQDAVTLSGLLKTTNKSYIGLPRANTDKPPVDKKEAGFNELLEKLKGN